LRPVNQVGELFAMTIAIRLSFIKKRRTGEQQLDHEELVLSTTLLLNEGTPCTSPSVSTATFASYHRFKPQQPASIPFNVVDSAL